MECSFAHGGFDCVDKRFECSAKDWSDCKIRYPRVCSVGINIWACFDFDNLTLLGSG